MRVRVAAGRTAWGRIVLACGAVAGAMLVGTAIASPASARTAARTPTCHPTVLVNTPSSGVATIDTATGSADPTTIGMFNTGDLVVAPDGTTAFVNLPFRGAVATIDLETRTMAPDTVPVGGYLSGLALTADGKTLVVGSLDGHVSRIDVKTMTKDPTDTPIPAGLHQIAITRDGKTAFVTNYGGDDNGVTNPVGSVSTIDVKTGRKDPADVAVGGTPLGVAVTPNGKTAFVVNGNQPTDLQTTVSAIDVRTRTKTHDDIAGVGVGDGMVAFTPNGRTAVVTSAFGGVSLLDVKKRSVVTRIPMEGVPLGVAITPDGSTAYVVNEFGGTVTKVDLGTGTVSPPSITIGGQLAFDAITPCRVPERTSSGR